MQITEAQQPIQVNINRHGWWGWLPTLYFMRGMPYVVMFFLSLMVFNRMGIADSVSICSTSLLLLPVVLRPVIARMIAGRTTYRRWIIVSEAVMTISIAIIAVALNFKLWFAPMLLALTLTALASAVHDIAVSRFFFRQAHHYQHSTAYSFRSFSYCAALLVGIGIMPMLGGNLEVVSRSIASSWSKVFWLIATLFLILTIIHWRFLSDDKLPAPHTHTMKRTLEELAGLIQNRSHRPYFTESIVFIVFFIVQEAFFFRIALLFIIDPGSNGGLMLSPQEAGFVQGSVGAFAIIIGAIIGSMCVRRYGLKACMWPMVAAITIPKAAYVFLAYSLTSNLGIISVCTFIEQLGTGFGIVFYLLFLTYYGRGKYSLSYYALGCAIAAISLVVCGIISGYLQEFLGYRHFFVAIVIMSVIPLATTYIIRIDPDFGKAIVSGKKITSTPKRPNVRHL